MQNFIALAFVNILLTVFLYLFTPAGQPALAFILCGVTVFLGALSHLVCASCWLSITYPVVYSGPKSGHQGSILIFLRVLQPSDYHRLDLPWWGVRVLSGA